MTATDLPVRVCEPISAPPFGNPMDACYRLGRSVVKWIQKHCVYGQGDRAGDGVVLDKFQIRFLLQFYELRADGRRRYKRGLLEVPKGNGKTPLSAWVGLHSLTHQPSAEVIVAAASFDQAGLLYGDAKFCAQESATLAPALEAFEKEIQVRDSPSRLLRVAAVAGTNDGKRPSAFLADEIHEWLDNKAEVHGTIERGIAKRADGFTLNTTTPGADLDSLAGQLHLYGLKVNSGEIVDRQGFLFVWYGCPEDRYDLSDEAQKNDPDGFYDSLCAAVRDANPAADSFLDVDAVAGAWPTMHRSKFLRYHLGLWTQTMESWLPAGAFEARAGGEPLVVGDDVVVVVDGSYNNDSTGIVIARVAKEPHLEVGGIWERPDTAPGEWTVPILEVEERIREICSMYNVAGVFFDPFRWARTMEVLQDPSAGMPLPVVAFPQTGVRMVPATARFYEAAVNGFFTHDNHPALVRHVANCRVRNTSAGQMVAKEAKNSTRKIDLAVCAIMALDRAATPPDEEIGVQAW